MKTRKRAIPQDSLSVEEKGRTIHVFTHRNTIVVTVAPAGCTGLDRHFTFTEFYNLFLNLKQP